jgi:cell division protein FtsI/penicillin-binding protein 2
MGFSPGRIDPETLWDTIDLTWIARPLYWDDPRLEDWTYEARRRWRSWRDHYAVPHLLVEFIARGEVEREPEALLDLLWTAYMEPAALEAALDREPVRGARPAVLGSLPELFGVPAVDPDLDHDAVLGEPGATRAERWSALLPLVDRVDTTDESGRPDPEAEYRVGRLRAALASPERLSRGDLELLAEVLIPAWEARYQEAVARALSAAAAEVDARGDLAPNGRLSIDPERRDRALETLRDVVRDYGSRSVPIEVRPTYEVVYLLARLSASEGLAGFRAVDSRLRVREDTVAAELVGSVSAVGVDQIQRQRRRENRMRELSGRVRSDEEDEELGELVGELLLRDESRGVSGVEGEWDDELRGRNGYRELFGLEDVYGRGRTAATLTAREDGNDLVLSIDGELQRAVERMLEEPEYDREDPLVDRGWFEEPVGAIVLLDAEGRVVVAASVPNENTEARETERADRSVRMDRTLRKPAFQPPGSVFKPFVAAWALDRLGLDPAERVECAPLDGPPEYGGVRCWYTPGHGRVDLLEALEGSCNCYFAWLGEQYPSARALRMMANTFGFGQPTGLRREGTEGGGLYEEHVPRLLSRRLTRHEARLAGNGLAVVEATPMQVARGILALATGELRPLSNVVRVGDRVLPPPAAEDLGLSDGALELVRSALRRVAGSSTGTAYRALNPDVLGTEIVVKTGSADLAGRATGAAAKGRPKHTWVAGWLPPERPVAAFAVFLDRARATSSHTAVYVARQLLRLDEVRRWLEGRGVPYRF